MSRSSIRRSPQNTLEALKTQTGFLHKSIQAFDGGDYNEALRLSTALRIILSSKGRQESLLDQLGFEDMLFLNTCRENNPQNFAPWIGLVSMAAGGDKAMLIPNGMRPPMEDEMTPSSGPMNVSFEVDTGDGSEPFVSAPMTTPEIEESFGQDSYVDFDYWWNAIVVDNKHGIYLSRRDVTLLLCDKDGGAHIDKEIPQVYERMQSDPYFFFKVSVNSEHVPYVFPPAYAVVRAIAGETVGSINLYLEKHKTKLSRM